LKSHDKENSHLDNRYDAFLAAVLEKFQEKLRINQEVSIITWNYDFQFELAYFDYTNGTRSEAREQLNVYPSESNKIDESNKSRIIKLNGTADNYFSVQNKSNQETLITTNYVFDKSEYPAIFNSIRHGIKSLVSGPDEIKPFLNFAWERSDLQTSQKAFGFAKNLIKNAQILVIIGYSFPVFNREYDKQLFSESAFRKIYIQACKKDLNGIEQRVQGILKKGGGRREPEIIQNDDTKQFFIPFEL
jgi:hypothetical protein